MVKLDVVTLITTSIVSAFAFIAALFWRDVISEAISLYIVPGDRFIYKILAAVLVTVVVIVAMYLFLKIEQKAEEVVIITGKKFGKETTEKAKIIKLKR